MKHTRIAQFTLLTVFAALLAFGGYSALSPSDAVAAADDDTPLQKEMEIVDESLRKLRRSLRKKEAELEESLKLIDAAQMANVKCKEYLPKMTEKIPEAEKAAFLKEYRVRMVEVMQKFCEMELAVLDGKWEEAEKCYDALREMEETGHEKYIEEE